MNPKELREKRASLWAEMKALIRHGRLGVP
jgi:hypothetical protein